MRCHDTVGSCGVGATAIPPRAFKVERHQWAGIVRSRTIGRSESRRSFKVVRSTRFQEPPPTSSPREPAVGWHGARYSKPDGPGCVCHCRCGSVHAGRHCDGVRGQERGAPPSLSPTPPPQSPHYPPSPCPRVVGRTILLRSLIPRSSLSSPYRLPSPIQILLSPPFLTLSLLFPLPYPRSVPAAPQDVLAFDVQSTTCLLQDCLPPTLAPRASPAPTCFLPPSGGPPPQLVLLLLLVVIHLLQLLLHLLLVVLHLLQLVLRLLRSVLQVARLHTASAPPPPPSTCCPPPPHPILLFVIFFIFGTPRDGTREP